MEDRSEVRLGREARRVRKEIHIFEDPTHNSEVATQTLSMRVGRIAKAESTET